MESFVCCSTWFQTRSKWTLHIVKLKLSLTNLLVSGYRWLEMGFNFGDCWFGLNHNDHNNHHDLPEEVGEMIQNKKNSDFIKAVNKNTQGYNCLFIVIWRHGIIVCHRAAPKNTTEKTSTSNQENNVQMGFPNRAVSMVTASGSGYTYPRPQSDIYEEAPDSVIGGDTESGYTRPM